MMLVQAAAPDTAIGQANPVAIGFFFAFISLTLGITYWAAKRTRTTKEFYAAGRSVTAMQNGLALAGDYMSAASFLGIAGLVSTKGYDGLIYSVGWLVGWPIITFLIAEPLRNLGKYTFSDVVAFRLTARPIRAAAAFGSLITVIFYLIAQMVGAGTLFKMMFNLPFEAALLLVGVLMISYVLFGGMIATTWVQIIKAVLLLGGATLLVLLVLNRFGFSYGALFGEAARLQGEGVLKPSPVASPLDNFSLALALMFGTAGLPHILMRFYTVPDAKAARKSVFYATGFIGYFYILTVTIGFGAMTLIPGSIATIKKIHVGGNMAAPMLAEALGGSVFLGFLAAVAFATILAVVAGLTLAGASALSHDLYVGVIRNGQANEKEEVKVAKIATVGLGVTAMLLALAFKDQNVAFMVGLAFAVASSANFPALLLSVVWKNISTKGATYSIYTGGFLALALIIMSPTVWVDIFHKSEVTAVNKVATDTKKAIDADLAAKLAQAPAEADKLKAEATAAKAAADAKAKADMPKPIIKYKNPGIFSMGAAFLVAIIFSLLFPEGGNVDKRFEDEKIRTYLGIGAE